MYKIYINNAPLVLLSETESGAYQPEQGHIVVQASYLGKPKFFFNYIDLLEKNGSSHEVILICRDVVRAFEDFSALFEPVHAGGGLVVQDSGKVLLIYRRGFWDLPKGKMDAGENILQTSVREVREETGLRSLQAGDHLCTTYHTYRSGKGKRVLKVCTWFLMYSSDTELTPQTEEDIEQAVWADLKAFLREEPRIFNNIREVLHQYLGRRVAVI